jgi:methyl-accepting chemotaxis protein
MSLTIGKKLGFGFGAVIALLAVSAGIAYYNIAIMRGELSNVLNDAVPTARSCERVNSSLNEASATLRGFLVSQSDSKELNDFVSANVSAWNEVDAELSLLTNQSSLQSNPKAQELLKSIIRDVAEQREFHNHIMELQGTDDNVPARMMFKTDFVPRAEQYGSLLGTLLDAEVSQKASGEGPLVLKALADLRESMILSVSDMRAYLASGDQESKAKLEACWKNYQSEYQAVNKLSDGFSSDQKQLWNQVTVLHQEISALPAEVIRLRAADNWNRAEYLWINQSAPRGLEIRNLLSQLSSLAGEQEAVSRGQLQHASQTTIGALTIATVVGIILGSIIAYFLSRTIVVMVRALAERAQQISEGNLTGSAIAIKGADELGHLADGFNVMLSSLRDLTGQILSVTENVNSAASQISSSAKQQASSTKEQAATVQEITSTMQELSQSGAQIVSKAKEVAAVAEQASTASNSGMEAVQNTNRTMEAIREQVEEVAENIVALSEKTQAVGEIITTVNEIAEQSNLLALNATIEAADAGDEGSRFSVVAAEMKNLADQAKECTVHVRKILGEIQKSINTSVMLTEEAVKRVESGKQQADVSENVIRQISATTEESIQAFQQIIGATNQQQVGFEQVTRGMQDIDQSTQQTATGTAQLEQAVVSLSALSNQLQTAVASYKL